MKSLFNHKYPLLKNCGFKRKGNAFFRIQGDGVIQLIKLEPERYGKEYEIKIGLFSMYSRLMPQWLTSKGCIPRYSIYSIADHVSDCPVSNNWGGEFPTSKEMKIQKALLWLDSINTQQALADGLCLLDTAYGGKVIWADRLKVVPFLLSENYDSAKLAVEAILKQHHDAYKQKQNIYSTEELERVFQRRKEEDTRLEYLLSLIDSRNYQEIQKYAKTNFDQNSHYAKLW